jgi:hypothetical protein
MRPDLSFEVLDWLDSIHVLRVRVYGRDHRGNPVDVRVTLDGPLTVAEVHALVAKINSSNFR